MSDISIVRDIIKTKEHKDEEESKKKEQPLEWLLLFVGTYFTSR